MAEVPAVIKGELLARKLDPERYNVLVPSETYGEMISKFEKVSIEIVRVDIKDCYKVGGGLQLGNRPLAAMANAVGIQWHPDLTGIVAESKDMARAKAVAVMKKPNGESVVWVEEKTIDLEAAEEEIRLGLEADKIHGNYSKWKFKEDMELEVRSRLLQKRKFKNELAMTGAKLRCIRKLLAVGSNFTPADLSKPFVVPKVVLDTQAMLDDPVMREVALDAHRGAVHQLFGGANGDDVQVVKPAGEYLEDEAHGALPVPTEAIAAPVEAPEIEAPAPDFSLKREAEEAVVDEPEAQKPVDVLRSKMLSLADDDLMPQEKAEEVFKFLQGKSGHNAQALEAAISKGEDYLKHKREAITLKGV